MNIEQRYTGRLGQGSRYIEMYIVLADIAV